MKPIVTSINRSEVAQVVEMTKGMLYMTLQGEDVINILSIIIVEAILENTDSPEEAADIFGDVHATIASNFKLTSFQMENKKLFVDAANMATFIDKNSARASEKEIAAKDAFLNAKSSMASAESLEQALNHYKTTAEALVNITGHLAPLVDEEIKQQKELKDLAIRYAKSIESASQIISSLMALEELPKLSDEQNIIVQEFTKGTTPVICEAELSQDTVMNHKEKAEEQILHLSLMQALVETEH